jgi:hypothetical protein
LRGLNEDARLVDADRLVAGFGGADLALRAVFFLFGNGVLRFPPFPVLRFAMTISWKLEARES